MWSLREIRDDVLTGRPVGGLHESYLSLDPSGTRATVVRTITSPRFDVPTTVARFGNRLYLPNARFTTPPTPSTPYSVTQVPAGP